MKIKKYIACFIAISMIINGYEAIANSTINNSNLSISSEKIYSSENIKLNGEGIDITESIKNKINKENNIIFIDYTLDNNDSSLQTLFGISNSKVGNKNSYIDIFLRNNGEIGIEARDTKSRINHLVSRPASSWGKYKSENLSNKVAMKLDSNNKKYSLFVNGTKVEEKYFENYLNLNNIKGIDKFTIGSLIREGKNTLGFKGFIKRFDVYNGTLSDSEIIKMTENKIKDSYIYKANDSTGSNYFRIPVLYTFSNGRIFSSIDARYGGTHDFLNKINIATSYSDDNGNNWSVPKLTLSFDDFANEPLEWPREVGKRDWQISGGATYIDSVIIEANKKVFLFADVMPAGVSFREATRKDSGYKKINNKYYLKLKKSGDNDYNYTVRENGIIYNDISNKPTIYKMNKDFSIMENERHLKVEQYSAKFENGIKVEYKNGTEVNMNVFYKDSLFKVVPTNYIAYITSKDFGDNWSEVTLLPPIMGLNRNAPYLGPGRGIVVSTNKRIIIPSYTGKESVYIYSDDEGLTWNSKVVPLPSNWSAEAQIVEIAPGILQSYMRTNNGKIAYMTSRDGGDNWESPKYLDFISSPSYGTELAIINYSKLVDGKKAIILSTPNSNKGRRNGQIWIGLINEDNTINWKYHHNVDYPEYGYSYSTLTELPNNNIGLMFEKFDSWSRNELHMKNVVPYVTFSIEDLKSNKY